MEVHMVYKSFDQILEKVKANPKKSRVAVVGAANSKVLESIFKAEDLGIASPVLLGEKVKIIDVIIQMGKNPDELKLALYSIEPL